MPLAEVRHDRDRRAQSPATSRRSDKAHGAEDPTVGRAPGLAARVIATASSSEKADLAREAGADAVVDYHDPDAAEQVQEAVAGSVQRIVEVALGANMELDQAVLAPNGTVATYGTGGSGP